MNKIFFMCLTFCSANAFAITFHGSIIKGSLTTTDSTAQMTVRRVGLSNELLKERLIQVRVDLRNSPDALEWLSKLNASSVYEFEGEVAGEPNFDGGRQAITTPVTIQSMPIFIIEYAMNSQLAYLAHSAMQVSENARSEAVSNEQARNLKTELNFTEALHLLSDRDAIRYFRNTVPNAEPKIRAMRALVIETYILDQAPSLKARQGEATFKNLLGEVSSNLIWLWTQPGPERIKDIFSLIAAHLDPDYKVDKGSKSQPDFSSVYGYKRASCRALLLLSDATDDKKEMQSMERLAVRDAATALNALRALSGHGDKISLSVWKDAAQIQ